ncbi:MAG TPA: [FeFe] hydrogenase H-cluster maturation GTPase HydF [Bacteroidales bacterium]|nr:[FeFe] hydrogenase H-cluster maturation GTPase HydF [Bacteroidales bacterium]
MAKSRESKPHIGIFGRRNNGKSALINALVQQEVAIVSDVAGTTTDPVKKTMEWPGIGPVILVDTAGIDDLGDLGTKRVKKTLATLRTIDLAVLVIADNQFDKFEHNLIREFNSYSIPFIIVHNKADIRPIASRLKESLNTTFQTDVIDFCSLNPTNYDELMQAIQKRIPPSALNKESLLRGLIMKGDLVLLITPIDSEAPEGRMILPQVQAIRDILDNECIAVVARESEVKTLMDTLHPTPALVITDSQIFEKANAMIPPGIPLTSFSIMLARHKGDFENYLKGTPFIDRLADGNRVLILESCTHHVTCDDIGRFKIPRWMLNYTGKELDFDVVAGLGDLPRPITDYSLVVQCGGCVITRRQVTGRLKEALDAGVPITNYGMAIAFMHGIFQRAVAPFLVEYKNEQIGC